MLSTTIDTSVRRSCSITSSPLSNLELYIVRRCKLGKEEEKRVVDCPRESFRDKVAQTAGHHGSWKTTGHLRDESQ